MALYLLIHSGVGLGRYNWHSNDKTLAILKRQSYFTYYSLFFWPQKHSSSVVFYWCQADCSHCIQSWCLTTKHPNVLILGSQSYPGEPGFLFSGETLLCGSHMGAFGQDPAGNQRDKWTLQLLESPLPPLPGLLVHGQKRQILTAEILLPRVMGKTLPLQITDLPTAFGTCTLKSVKQLSSVMMKDTCRTAMKHPVNAGTWHSSMLPRETLFVSTGSEAITPR